jgi:Tetratricopeptide repeat
MGLLERWKGIGAPSAWRVGLGVAILLGAGLSLAQPITYPECTHKPTPADVEGAKGAHKAATQFYEQGNYDRAIQDWRDAYSFDCTAHGVLINIANAYEKKGDKAAAIATLETYVKRDPTSPNIATIQQKIANLKASLATPTPSGTVPVVPTAAPSAAPSALPSASASTEPPPPPASKRPYGITPLIVAGGGVAAALVGVILLPVGAGNISSAEKVCPIRNDCNDPSAASTGNSGRALEGVGTTFLVLGGLGIGGGLVWEFAFNKPVAQPKQPAGLTLTPTVGLGSLGLKGSF